MVVNPAHMKNVPGHKTNSKDATWVAERSREVNRIPKVFEGAHIQLASVATDVLGVSGRAMQDRLAAGATDSTVLADWAARNACDRQVASLASESLVPASFLVQVG